MSVDPSFGAKPVVVPDRELVQQLLDGMELKYAVDDDGDLTAPWEDFHTYFMFRGADDEQAFIVRTFYDRVYPIDEKPGLLEAVDDWNRNTLWPKVYTHTDDAGDVRLVGEAQMLIAHGVNLEQFLSSTVNWIRASI
ncbi:MAG: YbjN domain-containing protein, partial [Mycobacteriaceae bacterium]|nr:YbjN domain-containing protein [Mycobacteriaceae bacterium]